MAAKILMKITTSHNEYHDIESLVWVMTYCALRWLPHAEYSGVVLQGFVGRLFDEHRKDLQGRSHGGSFKAVEMLSSMHLDKIVGLPPMFAGWFTSVKTLLADSIREHNYDYSQIRKDDLRRCWQKAVEVLESRPLDKSLKAPSCDRVEHQFGKAPDFSTPHDSTWTDTITPSLSEHESRPLPPTEADPDLKCKAALIEDGAEEEVTRLRYITRRANRNTSKEEQSSLCLSGAQSGDLEPESMLDATA
jgi:hypothetical protein